MMSTLCRVEYLAKDGWFIAHRGCALIHPESYPHALAERGIIARVTVLDDKLQPSGPVYTTEFGALI